MILRVLSILWAANTLALIVCIAVWREERFVTIYKLISGVIAALILLWTGLLFLWSLFIFSFHVSALMLFLLLFLPLVFPLLALRPKHRRNLRFPLLSIISIVIYTSHPYISRILTLGGRGYTADVWQAEHLPEYYFHILGATPLFIVLILIFTKWKGRREKPGELNT